ncbi:hypothetical protein D3Z39_02100 [Anaerotruncus colihominis]|uniref:Uncharacterized protein n=1 Tax=Anaerotruncus colihominis TaxID=169435 RepID=A0A845RBW8_9FIRM|nr:hypothetical protein [Anaerotruncus colihominis]NDO38830.1 hypothetical protein [Anaerotruncus colihominis]
MYHKYTIIPVKNKGKFLKIAQYDSCYLYDILKNSCFATIFCASARSAGRRVLIKGPRARNGADG